MFFCWVAWVLYIFWILILIRYMVCKHFSHSVSCLFALLMVSFAVQKLLVWCSPSCLFLFLLPLLLVSNPKKHCQDQCKVAYPMVSSRNFMVLGLKVLNPFPVNFCEWYELVSNLILLHVNIQFSQDRLLKRLSYLHWLFLATLSNVIWTYMHGFISGLSILFYWSVCLFFVI